MALRKDVIMSVVTKTTDIKTDLSNFEKRKWVFEWDNIIIRNSAKPNDLTQNKAYRLSGYFQSNSTLNNIAVSKIGRYKIGKWDIPR